MNMTKLDLVNTIVERNLPILLNEFNHLPYNKEWLHNKKKELEKFLLAVNMLDEANIQYVNRDYCCDYCSLTYPLDENCNCSSDNSFYAEISFSDDMKILFVVNREKANNLLCRINEFLATLEETVLIDDAVLRKLGN